MKSSISIPLATALRDIRKSREICGFCIDPEYSGRYMYDKTCLGLSVSCFSEAFRLILALEDPVLERELTEFFSCCSWDSMGEGIVLYGRGFSWPKAVKLED